MKTVPGDKAWTLMGEVNTSKAALAGAQEGFADRVVVAPNKVVVNSNVLKLWAVAIRTQHLLVPEQGRTHDSSVMACLCLI